MGVSDGVYMWREQGIDAGLFSRGLMDAAAAATSKGCVSPLSMMRKAYKATLAQGLKGSATVCLVVFDSLHGVVNSANIGDSGYLLMRPPGAPGERVLVKYRSPHQEHEFGRPFQLGHHEVCGDGGKQRACPGLFHFFSLFSPPGNIHHPTLMPCTAA